MIALSIFLIVITIGVGSLLNAYLVNKKSQNMRSIIDSLSFAMEDMSKNIRTGFDYHCMEDLSDSLLGIPKSCEVGLGIAFKKHYTDYDENWIFYIQNGKLFKSTEGLGNAIQLTPDEVVLDGSSNNFVVVGAESTDQQQPFVIIRLVGKISSDGNETPFSLQTMVSQRKSDI